MDHHDRPRDMTTTEYVGFAIRQFRRFARKHGVHRWVTVSIERVEFKAPVHVGDVVSLYTRPVSFGRSSITVEVRVVAERWVGGASAEVTNATVKMVATDRHGRSIDFRSAPTVVEPS